jgi:glycerol-3-phosphate acyltransferase PlsY
MVMLWALMIWRHRANLRRMMNGTEPKVGRKKKPL